jgi:hypothetical protein
MGGQLLASPRGSSTVKTYIAKMRALTKSVAERNGKIHSTPKAEPRKPTKVGS